MINVSENLKSLISEDSRTFRVKLVNEMNTYEEIHSFKNSVVFPSSSLSIGNALAACIECTAGDIPISIMGQKIKAEITILGVEESILLGEFKVEKPTVKDGAVSFIAYDAMKTAAEKNYKSSLDEGEHTAREYFADICTTLGAEYKPLDEADGDLVIAEDKLSGYSCRDALGYLAGYLGKNCLVNRDGLFEMVAFTSIDYDLLNETRITEPEFADSYCCLGYVNCCIDNETTLQSGEGSNGFEFISPVMTQERLDVIGETVFGESSAIKEYRPCKVVQLLGDPRIEVCDVIPLSYKDEIYSVPVMSVVLEYDGGLMATIESFAPTEPQSTTLNERMSFAQKQAEKKRDAHIKGIVEFSQLIQAAYGVKSTTVEGITYFHDMETLTESSFIFCITSEGFAQASGQNCWGGSHKDTVWKYGLSKDGNAVLNMLNVFKITASLIKAGLLESNDGSAYFDLDEGVIGVKETDSDGNEKFSSKFSPYGFDMFVKQLNSIEGVTLTEIEEAALERYLLNKGYKKDGTVPEKIIYQEMYAFYSGLYKAAKPRYGVNIVGEDAFGNSYTSHHGADRFSVMKTDEEGNNVNAKFTADGIESTGKQTFKAPEMYFEGNMIPRILFQYDEDGNKTNFDNFMEVSRYVGETTLGNGEESNYDNSPSAVKASFLFEVLPTGSSNQIMQRITLCSKGNSHKWERHYHSGAWGIWQCTYADKNAILWSGAEQMGVSEDGTTVFIELAESISVQPSGVALVFSYYSDVDGAQNYQFHTFFHSKHEVAAFPGLGHQYFLCSQNFGVLATKYLYINDKKITGNEFNTASGTAEATGLKYDNGRYVLRYVIGI